LYTSIYAHDAPALLEQLANTPEMQRLSDVGMHCGCEYSDVIFYKQASCPYTRLMHSVGTARIIWNFTNDTVQAVAGMLHDIATPVFAHTIDFMNNDHMTQESTEEKTFSFIENSKEILLLLEQNSISINDIGDYHKYPIADNDTPMLSADRLEYTLGNGYTVYNMSLSQIEEIYADLAVAVNEYGAKELCFRSTHIAKRFVEMSLRNSRFFVSNEDRFLMQYLADIMRRAIDAGVISQHDLYSTESEVIRKLKENKELSADWYRYSKISAVAASKEELYGRYCVKVLAKKRFIDPLVLAGDGVKRISEIDADIKTEIDAFLSLDFNEWLYEALYSRNIIHRK